MPDVDKAWPFYRGYSGRAGGAPERARTPTTPRIGFSLGEVGFGLVSTTAAWSGDSRLTLSQLAADFGATFVAVVLYVQDPVVAAQHALRAGGRLQPEAASGAPTFGGYPVEVIVD